MTVFLKKFIKSISLLFFTLILFSSQTFAGVTFVDSFDVNPQETFPRGLAFNSDGSKMFVVGNSNDKAHEYNLGTDFDVSTAVYVDGYVYGYRYGYVYG